MKYLVMECRSAYAVVLGDDGSFHKVANMRYEVGQTVTDVVALRLPEIIELPKTNHRRWIPSFAAMAACLVLMISSIFFTNQMPYASVYMTINPEVRIDVSRSDMVVGVEGMNDDGATLLNGYDHKKKNLDTVMDELVDRAIDMGYLHEGGRITLSLDGDEDWIVNHGDSLNQHLNEHLTDKLTVTIDIEKKQPTPTAPIGTIVIPVGPENYGDSDYDHDPENDYGPTNGEDSAYGESDYDMDDTQSDYDDPGSDYVSSGDGNSDYNQSDYDEPEDDGQTDYDDWSEDDSASDYNAQTDYNDAESDDFSDYDEPEDNGQTIYDNAEGSSDYDASDYDYEESSDYDEE